MFKNIDHISIVVEDLESAKQFFLDLGFNLRREGPIEGDWITKLTHLEDVKGYYVGLILPNDQMNLELMTFDQPKGGRDEHISQLNQIGYRHLAFAVEDIDLEVEKLKNKGIEFLSPVQNYEPSNKKLVYFLGPEGIVLEMAEYLKDQNHA